MGKSAMSFSPNLLRARGRKDINLQIFALAFESCVARVGDCYWV